MQIEMIYATDPNGIIGLIDGNNYKQPYYSKKDFDWFKQCTYGQIIVMGYNTFKAIRTFLEGRHNIILTSKLEGMMMYKPANMYQASSIKQALHIAHHINKDLGTNKKVIFIGGKSVYEQIEPFVSKMLITQFDQYVEEKPDVGFIRYIPQNLSDNFKLVGVIPFEDVDKYLDIPLSGEFQVWEALYPLYLSVPQSI